MSLHGMLLARAAEGNPLRIGLSVSAIVDVSDQSGPRVAGAPLAGVMRGNTGEDTSAEVDALVARILTANGMPAR